MAEGLQVLRAAGIVPAQLTVLPASRLPWVLRLPTPLFRLLASRMLRIDALARSSMADDLAMGRATEIDELCGAIVRLAQQAGVAAPLNERMAALVREQSARFPLPAPALSRLLTASAG
jgi:2-dehydropantoate 2-reductase